MPIISSTAPLIAPRRRYCKMYRTREVALKAMILPLVFCWKLRRKTVTATIPIIIAKIFIFHL